MAHRVMSSSTQAPASLLHSGPLGVVAASGMAIGVGAAFVNLIGFLEPAISADLGRDRAALGLVVSSYFGAAGFGSVAAARLADQLGARAAMVVALGVVAACCMFSASVGSYWSLIVGSLGAGLAYAVLTPATNIAVSRTLVPRRHGIGLTVKTAGGPIVAATGALLSGLLVSAVGWRILLAGLATLVVAGALWAAVVMPPARSLGHPGTPGSELPGGFYWFPVAAFLFIAGAQPAFSWVVPYLRQSMHAGAGEAGMVTSIGISAGVVGMIVMALRSDRRGTGQRIPVLVGSSLACALGEILIALGGQGGLGMVAIGTVLASVGMLTGTGLLHAALVDAAPQAVGRATGVTLTGFYLGAFVAPVAFGYVADGPGGYGAGWLACSTALVLSAAAFTKCASVGHRACPVAG